MVLSALLLVASQALAGIHETWIHEGVPSEQQIADWSAHPGTRNFLLMIDDPADFELRQLARLRGADRLQIETRRFPAESSVEGFRGLKNVDLITLDAGLPTADEIEILNRIDFHSQIFVVTAFPGADAKSLAKLRAPTSLTFAARFYPRMMDKEGFLNVPAHMPLIFSTDYWPWFTHMDVLSLLPNTKKLRVRNMFPPRDSLQYLHGIRGLEEAIVDTDFDAPNADDWENFGAIKTRWSSRDRVPSVQGLKAFEKSARLGERRLIIDMDRDLGADERTLLESSPLEVEWIREVY